MLLATLVAYVTVTYGHAFQLAFVNDDYFFLDKVRRSSLIDLWKPQNLIFDWYRPLSRELHYWVLLHVFGPHEPAFHLVNFALWLGIMLLYFLLIRRIAGESSALIATAGLAALGLWGGPILWVAGAQDLWMLLFSLLTLHAIARRKTILAWLAFALALLSKETAAAIPSIALAVVWIVERIPFREAFRRTAGLWAILLGWAVLHPTLSARLFGPLQRTLETERRPGAAMTFVKTILTQVNLGSRFAPELGFKEVLLPGIVSAGILGAFLILTLWRQRRDPEGAKESARGWSSVRLGAVWALAGWWILILPSIGWHAYYGVLGSLGCWLVIGTLLRKYRHAALATVMGLAFLRAGQAATLSWDWGTDWYQTRAGVILGSIRARLRELHPTFSPHSRLYFAEIPNNIGLLAADGPAIRVWYDDPTLEGHYLSGYRIRYAGEPSGLDYFFYFEPSRALTEVRTGDEVLAIALQDDPSWQHHHEVLASYFIQLGNLSGAADEYGKLWRAFPERADYALFAGATREAMGELGQSGEFYAAARLKLGDVPVREQAASLVRSARNYREMAVRGLSAATAPEASLSWRF